MRAFVFAVLTATFAHSLTLNVTGAKLDGSFFSTIHIRDNLEFSCSAKRDDFKQITKILCSFEKRPKQTFEPITDRFFEIKSYQRYGRFYVDITPLYMAYFEPVCDNLLTQKPLRVQRCKTSTHWIVLGYKKKRPLIENDEIPALGLNFPISINTHKLPYVGSLNIAGEPIYFNEVEDVGEYLAIKKLYENENYYDVIRDVDDVLKTHPDSIFKPEMWLYKLRALYKLENFEDLNDLSKKFLRLFSSDKGVDEVLYLSARANEKLGLASDSDYFYSRLLDEHPKSAFASYALTALGEQKQRK